jgi:hypothetical protein
MSHHQLTLNYDALSHFRPDIDMLPVQTGDTISFQLGAAPPNSTFKITMNDPRFFSAAVVTDSNTRITVIEAAETSYGCQLFDSHGKLLSLEGQPGADVRPVGSTSKL